MRGRVEREGGRKREGKDHLPRLRLSSGYASGYCYAILFS